MNLSSKTVIRLVFLAVLVVAAVALGSGYAASESGGTPEERAASQYATNDTAPVVDAASGVTVVSTDSNSWLGRQSNDSRSKAEIMAFNPDGSVLYYNDSHTRYWDVDPVPGTEATIEYAYADHRNGSACPNFLAPSYYNNSAYANSVNRSTWENYARAQQEVGACTRNGVVRANMTTGETTTIYSAITPGKHSTRWHDADRINATHLAVADIFLDRVFIVDTRTNEIAWQWRPAVDSPQAFPVGESGGPYPGDWTHVNDVEVLPDGRLMASPRNNDRVVFLDPSGPPNDALQENWTLGSENDYSTLYEQHNPDYIPASQGGPAVIIGDSENNRAIEYQRVNNASGTARTGGANGSWERTWSWHDAPMQWPRDADRLPNGHTLIADSNGDRVFEVGEGGNIVWEADIGFPYEAERFPTGDESAGGPSAQSAGIESSDVGPIEEAWLGVKDVVVGPEFQALYYVAPRWMGTTDIALAVLFGIAAFGWLLAEAWWALSIRSRLSRVFAR